jgi:hypothetical protein
MGQRGGPVSDESWKIPLMGLVLLDPDDDALLQQELAAFGLRMDDDEPG